MVSPQHQHAMARSNGPAAQNPQQWTHQQYPHPQQQAQHQQYSQPGQQYPGAGGNGGVHYQPAANQQQHMKLLVESSFRNMLSRFSIFDQDEASQTSRFASEYHFYAQEITDIIREFIRDNPERQIVYLYVMDNIMKNVQGSYIRHFEPFINYVIGLVLQRASREDEKNLVKMFKTWEVLGLFNQEKLNDIAEKRNLRNLEAQLLTGKKLEKIQMLKEKHEPSHLPFDVLSSQDYIHGTQVSKQDIWAKYSSSSMAQMRHQPYPAQQAHHQQPRTSQQQHPYGNSAMAPGTSNNTRDNNYWNNQATSSQQQMTNPQSTQQPQSQQQYGAAAGHPMQHSGGHPSAYPQSYQQSHHQQVQQPQMARQRSIQQQSLNAGQQSSAAATVTTTGDSSSTKLLDLFNQLKKVSTAQGGFNQQVSQQSASHQQQQPYLENKSQNQQQSQLQAAPSTTGRIDQTDEREKSQVHGASIKMSGTTTTAKKMNNELMHQQVAASASGGVGGPQGAGALGGEQSQKQQSAQQASSHFGAATQPPQTQVMASSHGPATTTTTTTPGLAAHHQNNLHSSQGLGGSAADVAGPTGSHQGGGGQHSAAFPSPVTASATRAAVDHSQQLQHQQQQVVHPNAGQHNHQGSYGRPAGQQPTNLHQPAHHLVASQHQLHMAAAASQSQRTGAAMGSSYGQQAVGAHHHRGGNALGVRTDHRTHNCNNNVQSNSKSIGFR